MPTRKSKAADVVDALRPLPVELYVVQEHGTDYDDERTGILDSGTPQMIFSTREGAKAECRRLNFAAFKSDVEALGHFYSFDNASEDDMAKLRVLLDIDDEDDTDFYLPADATDDLLEKVMDLSHITFFGVVTVQTQR